MFSVQYTVHLYGYLKEWRKNPHWSFSCCIALILPLIDIPGDISGLSDTNVLNTQLDSGQMEMTTIAGAVQDSGAIDVTLEEFEQDDGDLIETEEDKCNSAGMQTGEQGQVHAEEVQETTGHITGSIFRKCHRGTQTDLSVHLFIADVGDQEPVAETSL